VKVFEKGWFHDGTWSSFRERHHGRPLDPDTEFSRLVVFSQDHDQIGNRAAGDRLSASVSDASLAVAAAVVLLGPFTPMLFMGEEWGATTPWQFFTSHPEKELGEATARGRIQEFAKMGWDPAAVPDPQDPATFERSHLDWSEPERESRARILDLYRSLIEVRRSLPLDARAADVVADPETGMFAFSRGDVRVVAVFGDGDATVPLGGDRVGDGRDVVASFGDVSVEDGELRITGGGVVVLR
jgi:maltooligosyltrehalose trehalohydrolase